MNKWGIPPCVETQVRLRDKACVYCHKPFGPEKRDAATWEHIDNERWDDTSIMSVNIALCCGACNSSKGAKPIREWFNSKYCVSKGIYAETVGAPVKKFLSKFP